MIAVLCAIAIWAQEEPKVTLRVPATGLAKILKEVSASTGTQVVTDPQFAEMPLVVSVKDVPLGVFLAKVAESMDMDVRPNNGGFRIVRSPDRLAKLQEAERQSYEDAWTECIVGTRKEFQKTPWSTKLAENLVAEAKKKEEEDAKKAREVEGARETNPYDDWRNRKPGIDELKPAARFAFRLVQAIGAKELSKFPKYSQVVLSRFPTPVQAQMPPQFEQFLAQYVREAALNPKIERDVPVDEGDRVVMRSWRRASPDEGLERIRGPIGKVLLTIPDSSSAGASISIYSQDGQESDSGSFGALPFYVPEEGGEESELKMEKLKPFHLSALSRELARFLSTADSFDFDSYSESDDEPETPVPHVSDELRAVLMNPEKIDPLSFAESEASLEFATQKQVNLVVRPEEDSYWSSRVEEENFDKEGRVDMTAALPYSLLYPPEKPDATGWVVRGADEPLRLESGFLSRQALGKFVRSLAKSGPTLDAFIDLAVTFGPARDSASASMDSFAAVALLKVDGIQLGSSLDRDGMRLVQVLGSLTPAQRLQATRGGITASALSREQYALLQHAVYNLDFYYGQNDEDEEEEPNESEEEKPSPPGYLNQSTEAIPNGAPAETRIKVSSNRQDLFRTRDGMTCSARQLAIIQLIARKFPKEEEAEFITEDWVSKKVMTTTSVTYKISVRVSKDVGFAQELSYRIPHRIREFVPQNSSAVQAELAPWLKQFDSYDFAKLQEAYFSND